MLGPEGGAIARPGRPDYSGRVSLRRLLPLMTIFALLVAPFGRAAAAEAMATPHHAPKAMSGHCDPMPASGQGEKDKSIDCMTTCAAMAPAEAPPLQTRLPTATVPVSRVFAACSGLHPEADPPPPRFS